ncbi:hypothetical protein, partial [Methanomethylophilus alvi]|uniref:hypothetical protein n=1 Tax=Methanomethylophilus alvi TaxID=1291540 RepID=UPI0037DCECE8
LDLHGKFQTNMDAASLTAQVRTIKIQPEPEDGWLPGGYEEMLDVFGPEVADAYLDEAIRQQEERLEMERAEIADPDEGQLDDEPSFPDIPDASDSEPLDGGEIVPAA